MPPEFIYNWGLAEWQRQYAADKAGQQPHPPTANSLKKAFNAIGEPDFSGTYEVTKCVVEGAFDDLGKADTHCWAKRAKFPRCKRKGKSRDSFYLANDKFTLGDHRVQVPVLGDFVVVNRFFPLTKRCHHCHHRRDIALPERTDSCLNLACGWRGDRDGNAAMNIVPEALRLAGRIA